MKINRNKTNILLCAITPIQTTYIRIQNEVIKEIEECQYLGSAIIKKWLQQEKLAFYTKKKLITSTEYHPESKFRVSIVIESFHFYCFFTDSSHLDPH